MLPVRLSNDSMSRNEAEDAFDKVFQYPFLWPPEKILSFIVGLRKELDGLKKSDVEFWNRINQTAEDFGILQYQDDNNQWSWGKAFTSEQLLVLTAFYNKQGKRVRQTDYEFSHVTDLVVAFRHRYEHQNEIPDEDKELLFGTNDLTDQIYVQFWISRFPKLLAFLWISFKEFLNNKPTTHYPPGLSLDNEMTNTDVSWFLFKLRDAILGAKFHGFLKERYTINDKCLEFYQLPTDILYNVIFTMSSVTSLHHSPNHFHFTVRWPNSKSSLTHTTDKVWSDFAIVFTYEPDWEKVHKSVIAGLSKTLIYFARDLSNINGFLSKSRNTINAKVKKLPLCLGEFDKNTIERVLNRNVLVGKDKKIGKLRRLLHLSEIINAFKGKDLNRLLGGSEFWMFRKIHVLKPHTCFSDSFLEELEAMIDRFKEKLLCDKKLEWASNALDEIARNVFDEHVLRTVLLYSMRKCFENIWKRVAQTECTKNNFAILLNNIFGKSDCERNLVNIWFFRKRDWKEKLLFFSNDTDKLKEFFAEFIVPEIALLTNNYPVSRFKMFTSENSKSYYIKCRLRVPAYGLLNKPLDLVQQNFRLIESHLAVNELKCLERESFDCIWELGTQMKLQKFAFPRHFQILAPILFETVNDRRTHGNCNLFEENLRKLESSHFVLGIYEHVVRQKLQCVLVKFNGHPFWTNLIADLGREMQMNDLICLSTILALECVFGKEISTDFEPQIIHDDMVKKVSLCNSFVLHLKDVVFCYTYNYDYIVADFMFKVIIYPSYLGVTKSDSRFLQVGNQVIGCVKYGRYSNVCKFFYLISSTYQVMHGNLPQLWWFPKQYETQYSRESVLPSEDRQLEFLSVAKYED